jgi:coproporphyrinogen III oxidase
MALLELNLLTKQQQQICKWFIELRNSIRQSFEEIEIEYAKQKGGTPSKAIIQQWEHVNGQGGGEKSVIKGQVFEKSGVNISIVKGIFDKKIRDQVPGATENPEYFAVGVSLVSHMRNPLVPLAHMNTRYIFTNKAWFGGGGDLTPTFEFEEDTNIFHQEFKECCDRHDPKYYSKFKKWCDEYFYLHHRQEPRGVGGIFYDNLDSGNFDADFSFTKDVGKAFEKAYCQIIRRTMFMNYSQQQKHAQLVKRGRYVEFNLLYDRGTKFGVITKADPEAYLMSMPPEVIWE